MSEEESIHSKFIDEIYDIPMGAIIRPLIPELNNEKVKSLMETLKVRKAMVNP